MKLIAHIGVGKFNSAVRATGSRFFSTKKISLERAREVGIQKEIKSCNIFPNEKNLYNIKVRGSRYYLYHLFLIRSYFSTKFSSSSSKNSSQASLSKELHREIDQNFPFSFISLIKFLSFGVKKHHAEQILLSYAIKAGNKEAVEQLLNSNVPYRGYFDGSTSDCKSLFVQHSSKEVKKVLQNRGF